MNRIPKVLAIFAICFLALLVGLVKGNQEIFIESRESKTISGEPVFNQIRWFQFQDKDVWMMNQSHHGAKAAGEAWDRLAIVIDKTQTPKTARFYQLEPGPLEFHENLIERSFKVSCFMCHNNGPRAIRPKVDSTFYPTSLKDRVKIAYWNMQIKLYGRVVEHPIHEQKHRRSSHPFRFRSVYENEPLQVAACVRCHKESGFFARGLLRRQQILTIKFMLESGQMPPLGFHLSTQDKKELQRFLMGL